MSGNIVSLFTREWIEIVYKTESFRSKEVSLFTREWIEIDVVKSGVYTLLVSLFTREWIEINASKPPYIRNWSPSLRGSGLKLFVLPVCPIRQAVSLFTREWIEIGK